MQNPFKGAINIDFYTNQARIKWFILIVAIIIGGGSIIYTNGLVGKLKKGEEEKIRLWAQAVEFSSLPDVDESALTFISNNIIGPDNTLPVIVLDSATQEIYDARNVGEAHSERQRMLNRMRSENDPFKIIIRNGFRRRDFRYPVCLLSQFLFTQATEYLPIHPAFCHCNFWLHCLLGV